MIQVRDSCIWLVFAEEYHEEEEEALGTVGVGTKGGMRGIVPSHLCWQNSSRRETGIPVPSQSERSVAMERYFLRLNPCFQKPAVWRRLVLF